MQADQEQGQDTKKLEAGVPAWFGGEDQPMVDGPAGAPVVLAADDERIEFEDDAPEEKTQPEGAVEELGAKPIFRLPEPVPNGTPGAIPSWARGKIPRMRQPKGVDVVVIRIPGAWTPLKQKGDRILVLWELNEADEKMAFGRGQGDSVRATSELAKQCIRAVDGHPADWSGDPSSPGSIDRLWHEIGAKGRNHLIRLSAQLNHPSNDQVKDFFENCIAVVSTG